MKRSEFLVLIFYEIIFLALYLEWMPEEERAWWVGAWEKKYTVVVLSTREGGSNQIFVGHIDEKSLIRPEGQSITW